MSSGVSYIDLDALFKKRYADAKKVFDMTLRDHPTLAWMPKVTSMGGKDFTIPVIGGNPVGVGSVFAAAQAAKASPGDQVAFVVRRSRQYGVYSIDGETLSASEGEEDAFMQKQGLLADRVMQGVMDETAIKLFRDGRGIKARISASADVGTATVALTNPTDVRLFTIGERVSLVNPGTGLYRNPGGNGGALMQVFARDVEAGTLTFTGVGGAAAVAITTSIAAAAAGDWIVKDGEFTATPTPSSGKPVNITGFDGWIPSTKPASDDSFWTVNRSRAPDLYAGQRLTASSGQLYKKSLTKIASMCADAGGKPDLFVTDFNNFEILETELDAKRVYQDAPDANFGFETLKINGPKGPITILADNRCQPDRGYMLQRETWELRSAKAFPRVIDDDGKGSMREVDSDGVEWRLGGYPNIVCYAPSFNGVVIF